VKKLIGSLILGLAFIISSTAIVGCGGDGKTTPGTKSPAPTPTTPTPKTPT